jgi:hypothetical protein
MLRLYASIGSIFLVLASCSAAPLDPPMTRSCRGEYVDACRPYTYARIVSASLTPNAITLNDPRMMAHVHVEFAVCSMAPALPTVQISAFIGGAGDAMVPDPPDGAPSTNARLVPLAVVGPPVSGATSIDVTIPNPFFANVPADTGITLQFAPVLDGCEGDMVSIPYHTGFVVGP